MWGGCLRPVDSRLRGNDGEGTMRIYRIVTMLCIVFTLAPVSGTGTGFDSSPIKGEGDSVGCVVLLLPRPVDIALKPV